jgi:hypothetical protein
MLMLGLRTALPALALVACVACSGAFASNSQESSADRSPSVTGLRGADAGIASESLGDVFGREMAGNEGLKWDDLAVGSGPSVRMGDMVKVHYVGRLPTGKEFDSSRTRGRPLEFTLGRAMVIRGFERGVVGMRIGGIRKIHIPYALGYGEQGSPPSIPPRTNLEFEVELIDVPLPAAPAEKKKEGGGGGFSAQ